MTTQVEWGDGSGEKIYLSYSASEGNQTVTITSDANTGPFVRNKNITFSATSGQTTISRILTVSQLEGEGIFLIDADGKYVMDSDGKYILVQPEDSNMSIITRNDVVITFNDTAVGYE